MHTYKFLHTQIHTYTHVYNADKIAITIQAQ